MGIQRNLGTVYATINGCRVLTIDANPPIQFVQSGSTGSFTIDEATTSTAGALSSADKVKLNSLLSGDSYVQKTTTINSKPLSANITLSPADIGASASNHTHPAADITSGVLGIARGGTGNDSGYIRQGLISPSSEVGLCATAEGVMTSPTGYYSHTEGMRTQAEDLAGHAEGDQTTASGYAAHAEGSKSSAVGGVSHAEGESTTAEGEDSHAEGEATTASGDASHSEGRFTQANGYASHAGGVNTIAAADYQTVIGKYNTSINTTNDALFLIGNGTSNSNRSNCFRVGSTEVSGPTYNTIGSDYAEMFEWEDGNPNHEDRVGRFVTLTGAKIRFANYRDKYILGVTSAVPTIIGDSGSDHWHGRYATDVFGRPVKHEGSSEEEQYIEPSSSYDSSLEYRSRQSRDEWSPVGLLGKLVCIDDGSCEVDSYAKPLENGIATGSKKKTPYRVVERIDDSHIRIFLKP